MLAFQEYLVGKHLLNQRTSESIQGSVQYFEQSIQEDSLFALPYASVAYAYTLIGVAGYGDIPRATAEAKAKDAMMKALEIDETLAEAHAALGYIKFRIDWDWKGAERELKRAIDLKPSYATAHEWYALFLAVHTRLDESLKEMLKAYELDPLSSSVNTSVARIYHFRNEPEKGLAQIIKALELDPNYAEAHFTAGMTYFKIKEYEKAEAALEKAVALSGRRPVMPGVLGAIYGKMGKIDEMKKLLAELETAPLTNDNLYATSYINASLGQTDEAFDILEKLLADRYGILIYLKVEKQFFSASVNPRYQQILIKMGL
jgi:tetratricopeptide (TPR) repeat protein